MKKAIFVLFLFLIPWGLMAQNEENASASSNKSKALSGKPFTHLEISLDMQKSLGIKTEKAKRGLWHDVLHLSGTVLPLPQSAHEIHAPVTGQVKPGLPIPTVGQWVKKGEVLAVLRQTLTGPEALHLQVQSIQAQAALAESRNNLSLKETAYLRAKRLYEIQIIALKDLQAAKTDYENALLEFESAKRQVNFYKTKGAYLDFPLLSPIPGVITAEEITRGETVDPRKTLFKVEDLSKVWIQIHVYENDIRKIHPGEMAEITAAALPGKTFYGKVRIVGMVVEPQSKTLPAMIELQNPGYRLKEGMQSQIALLGPDASALAIPASGLVRDSGSTFVFVRKEEADFYRRSVIVQKMSMGNAFILTGLQPGDEVVAQGAYLLNQEWHNRQSGKVEEEKEP